MNPIVQEESSGDPSGLPLKRRRGRPRKHPNLKHAETAHTLPGFEGAQEHIPQRPNNTVGIDYMVGQEVTGVVEATFEAGYLLTVKIGNSTTNLRGIVFKPGNYVPITAENDFAPHAQMIRRNNVTNTPLKRKYGTSKSAPSVPPVGARGDYEPVVLQPVNVPNISPISNLMAAHEPKTGHVLDFGDKSVHMVEPISMLPPDRSIPVGQIFATSQLESNRQVSEVSMHKDNGSVNENSSEVGEGDKTKSMTPTENDTYGSSESLDTKTENGGEALKASEDFGTVSKQEIVNADKPFSVDSVQFSVDSVQNSDVAASPLFRYGTGRMTELLQAVQENIKDNKHVQIAERPNAAATEIEFNETRMTETDKENETNIS